MPLEDSEGIDPPPLQALPNFDFNVEDGYCYYVSDSGDESDRYPLVLVLSLDWSTDWLKVFRRKAREKCIHVVSEARLALYFVVLSGEFPHYIPHGMFREG